MRKNNRPALILIALILLLSTSLTGCNSATETSKAYPMASHADMPVEIQNAPVTVREAYQFAAANSDVLEQLPCYCGCGSMGHTSNYACYVAEENSDGSLTYDGHALGCSICVDITRDAMRMLDEGKSVDEIFTYVTLLQEQRFRSV